MRQTLTNALNDLCEHSEYIESLRNEIQHSTVEASAEDLPLMDSFLKEFARLHPTDTGKKTFEDLG